MRILLIIFITISAYSANYTVQYEKDGNVSILHIDADKISVISGGVSSPPNPFFEPETIDNQGVVSKIDLFGSSFSEITADSLPATKEELLVEGVRRFGPQFQNLLGYSSTQPRKVVNKLKELAVLYNLLKGDKDNGKPSDNTPAVSSGNDRREEVEEAKEIIRWAGARKEYLQPVKVEKAPVTIDIIDRKASHLWFDDPEGDTNGTFIVGFKKNDDGEYILIPKTETHAGEGNKASTAFWDRHRKKKPTHAMVYARDYSARSAIFELEV